jgi:hypothetical protein
MNANINVRIAVNAILGGRNKEKHMTNFYLRLTPQELQNYTSSHSKLTWMKNWAARKSNTTPANIQAMINKKRASSPPQRKPNSQNTFNKYTNSLEKFMNENMNIEYHSSNNYDEVAAVNLSINKKGYIQIEPVCVNNRSKGVYIHYGETYPTARGQRVGFRLRKTAVNAARNSRVPLYQVSQNINSLVKKGNMPISGRIMQQLGAIRTARTHPCKAKNKRNNSNYAFVVNSRSFKRPSVRKSSTAPRRD